MTKYKVIRQQFSRGDDSQIIQGEVEASSVTGALYSEMGVTPDSLKNEGVPRWVTSGEISYYDHDGKLCEKDEAKAVVFEYDDLAVIIAETQALADRCFVALAIQDQE